MGELRAILPYFRPYMRSLYWGVVFVFFANLPKALPEHYIRYVHNSLRERWGFVGSPVRIRFREN